MEWIRGQSIGHGSFAKVSLAKPTSQNQTSHLPPLIAVKTCGLSHSASLKNEFMILNQLKDCPEIITCYGDSTTVENGEKLYNVVLEYASGGSLADKIKNSKNSESLRLQESDVCKYTRSVLKGLQFIHERGIVHCDIKPDNILLCSDDNVKIADFGLAKLTVEGCNMGYEVRGTPVYMAPETVVGGKQGPAADIWAVGCMVVEMLTGMPAWTGADVGSLLMRIGVGAGIPDVPGKVSDAGRDFIGKCFVKEECERWTAEMLLKHPFVDGEDCVASRSPRNPFDFPDWELEEKMEVTSGFSWELELESELESWETSVSTGTRLRQLATEEVPDWSDASGWVTVR